MAVHVGLLLLFDLAAHPLLTLALLGAGFAALVWATRRLGRLPRTAEMRSGGALTGGVLTGGVLLVAVILRALLLPLPPTLSDDLLRYVWDGRVATAGLNPYRLAPEDEELAPLRDELWRRLPHKDVPTVYPPLALGLFSIAASLPLPLLAAKLLLALADLGTCALLLHLAGRWRLPPWRAVWYAWNPLVTLEIAGMGHVDALGVAFVALALAALTVPWPAVRRTWAAAGAAVGGILAKLAPLAALPLWARHSRRPVLFLLVTGVLLLATAGPVLLAVGGVPPGLVTYGVQWEFNGPIYEPLWRTLDALRVDEGAKRLLDVYKQATEEWTRWNWIYPHLYPQLLAKLLLAGVALAVVVRSARGKPGQGHLLAATGRLFGALLLLSATFYPWYLLWVLPWAALAVHPAWLVLSATILVSYVPQVTASELFPWIFLLIWLPFGGLLVFGRGWSVPAQSTAEISDDSTSVDSGSTPSEATP